MAEMMPHVARTNQEQYRTTQKRINSGRIATDLRPRICSKAPMLGGLGRRRPCPGGRDGAGSPLKESGPAERGQGEADRAAPGLGGCISATPGGTHSIRGEPSIPPDVLYKKIAHACLMAHRRTGAAAPEL